MLNRAIRLIKSRDNYPCRARIIISSKRHKIKITKDCNLIASASGKEKIGSLARRFSKNISLIFVK